MKSTVTLPVVAHDDLSNAGPLTLNQLLDVSALAEAMPTHVEVKPRATKMAVSKAKKLRCFWYSSALNMEITILSSSQGGIGKVRTIGSDMSLETKSDCKGSVSWSRTI